MDSAIIKKSSLVILVVLITSANCSIPDYINVCPSTHQNLSACITNSIENLRSRLRVGINELGIPPMNQLHLGQITIDKIANGSRLTTNLTDTVVYGASEFQILKLTIHVLSMIWEFIMMTTHITQFLDFHKKIKSGRPTIRKRGYTFRFEVIVPKLYIEGKYELDSQVLFLDLVGKGPFNANISDYHFECILKGTKVKQGDNNYLQFEKMKCNLVIGKASILLENLFNGNQVLGRAVNDIINDNIDIFFNEVKPGLLDGVATKFTEIANKITLAFKYEDLFP